MAAVSGGGVPTWVATTSAVAADDDDLDVIAIEDLSIGSLIGKGRFKQVHQGKLRESDVVAVLRYNSVDEDSNEVQILRLLARAEGKRGFSCIPKIFGVSSDHSTGDILIVQEFAQLGSLRAALLRCRELKNATSSSLFTPVHMIQLATQIVASMVFLRSVRLVHADLACRNLLLCGDEDRPGELVTKVTDFGLAIHLEDDADSVCRKQPQATRWCAPESVTEHKYSFRSDCWSLGATLWELFARGANPWPRLEKRLDVAVRLKRLHGSKTLGASLRPSAHGGRNLVDLSNDFPRPEGCPEQVYTAVLSCFAGE